MSLSLNTIKGNNGKTKKRVGRGIGSGKGKTCGSGMKGQKSRSGVAINGFEGGQMPIHRRLPKRGFKNYNEKTIETFNLDDLQNLVANKNLKEGDKVDTKKLVKLGLVKGKKDGVKLLGRGKLETKLNLEIDSASKAAIKAIEAKGGSVKISAKKEKTEKKKEK